MADLEQQAPRAPEVRDQLDRILRSEQFSTARRLSAFLIYVVNAALDGAEVKEALIGVEVYGRDASYNPKSDSIVRAEASRLRAKLREYYDGSGSTDPILIDLPKGSYMPAFRHRVTEPPGTTRTAHPEQRRRVLLIPVVAAAMIVPGWWFISRLAAQPSIVVLALRNANGQPRDRVIDAVADELTIHLKQALLDSGAWKVIARPQQNNAPGRDNPKLEELRRDMKNGAILTGVIRAQSGRDVRVSLELLNTADGHLVWTAFYDRRLPYAADWMKELARVAAEAMTSRYGGRALPPHAEAYSQARELWNTFTPAGLEQSIPLFQQTVQANPNFAPAWAGLADAYVRLSEDSGEIDTRKQVDAARNAALRAVELDESDSEAHAALGRIYLHNDWNFHGAVQQFQRAVAVNPGRLSSNISYSQALTIVRDMDGALLAIRDARARQPAAPELLMQEGSVFFLARKFEKMESLGRELLALDPDGPDGHWLVGLSLELRGRTAEAIAEYDAGLKGAARDNRRILCALSHAYGRAGRRDKALETMRRFLPDPEAPLTRFTLCYCAALTYAAIGQSQLALDWLEKAQRIRDISFPFFPSDARFDGLKGDARYQRMAASLGAPFRD